MFLANNCELPPNPCIFHRIIKPQPNFSCPYFFTINRQIQRMNQLKNPHMNLLLQSRLHTSLQWVLLLKSITTLYSCWMVYSYDCCEHVHSAFAFSDWRASNLITPYKRLFSFCKSDKITKQLSCESFGQVGWSSFICILFSHVSLCFKRKHFRHNRQYQRLHQLPKLILSHQHHNLLQNLHNLLYRKLSRLPMSVPLHQRFLFVWVLKNRV